MSRRPTAGLLASLALLGAAARGGAEPSPEVLRRRIEAVVSRRAFASASWGIEVRGLRSGNVLYARGADKNLRPGSAMKLVTTAAALDALGPEVRLRTTVETAARLDDAGALVGDLWLVGRGDPSLSGRFTDGRITLGLEELADELKAGGVRRVEGRVVGHEGAFSGERRGTDWTWEDLVWSYGAEASALSFNDNKALLRLRPGARPGDPAFLEQEPASSHYRVTSTATTSPAGSKSEPVLDQPAPNVFRLSGVVAAGGQPWEGEVAIADPARYAASVFATVLRTKGIEVAGEVATSSDPLPDGSRVLAFHDSPPLAELLKVVNKESQNLHAEILLRLTGLKVKGQGTAEAGSEAAREFLVRCGVVAEGFSLEDGSGLSRSDLLSAHGLAGLLAAMERHPFARVYRDSLAEPGQKGTLEHRLAKMAGRLQAKTGTLRFANALAGFVTGADGDRLAFAVIVNNHTMPGREAVAAIDEIAQVLGEAEVEIALGPELAGRVRLGVLVLEDVTVREGDPALVAEVDGYCAELRQKYGEGKSAEVPGASDARTLYKAVGLDPTKYRPSNEALLRRALKGEALYRINTLVDALNLSSLRFQLPFGLYDLARVEPPVVLRKGTAGETYEGIRKGPVHVDGRPVLSDAKGPFGNPTSDSARTMITLDAKRTLVVAYAPAGYSLPRLGQVLDGTTETLTRHCGGREVHRLVL